MKKIATILALTLLVTMACAQAQTNTKSVSITEADFVAVADTASQNGDEGFVARVGGWYTNHLSYWSVTMLMALESSFIPFPSEIVVPPAAYAACNAESPLYATDSKPLNVLFVILFATLGALLGALVNYAIAYFLGRPFVYWFADSKMGHICMLDGSKVQKAEDYFVEHGNISTLVGRLIPVIRQLISIPAGLAKMRLLPFVGYTTLGALVWNIILAVLGYVAHGQQDLISRYSDELSWILLGGFAIFVAYLIFKGIRKRRQKQNSTTAE